MPFELNKLSDLSSPPFDTIIDVRSPSEYAEDHVPGAESLPVLSDEERARVGTIYVQESAFLARKIGAALVARNAAAHIEGPLAQYDGGWRPLVYCWRGGQRSGSFKSILQQIGWRADVIVGGYQSYRRHVVRLLYKTRMTVPVVLLDGNTGTGKTEILARLRERAIQVVDLEGLAQHRGSALGGQGTQPSQKGFESRLASELAKLDPTRPVVIEAESSKIGKLNLPPELFKAMKAAPRVTVSAPVGARAEYLTRAYADVLGDTDAFNERLERLVRLQGRERVSLWQADIRDGKLAKVATDLIEHHYDPRYAKVRQRVGADVLANLTSEQLQPVDLDALADQIAQMINERSATLPPLEEPAQ